ncbi:hypothetical protein EB796_010755 [Bugula neritina]|uniref:Uncharacterized protein n=1 Tax=Bugula neritina TaxID=10212 RepID=A0A7J7JZ29_BUGNE|nr:hypothetical protein EB796_010755 [Bugula neritina]
MYASSMNHPDLSPSLVTVRFISPQLLEASGLKPYCASVVCHIIQSYCKREFNYLRLHYSISDGLIRLGVVYST